MHRTAAKKTEEAVLEVVLALELSDVVSVQSQSPNLSCLSEATAAGREVVVVVRVVVVVAMVVRAGTGLTLQFVVVSRLEVSSIAVFGLFKCLRSTQHLMEFEGQAMSSLTSSHNNEAKACRHFPGQSLTSAVFVIVPNNPEMSKRCNESFCTKVV